MNCSDANIKNIREGEFTLPEKEEVTLKKLFTYQPPTAEQIPQYEVLREAALEFARLVAFHVPPGSDRTAAIRKIREGLMTANAGIALRGLNF